MNGSSILDFVNGMDCLLRAHSIDIILGDLNINFFNTTDMQPLINLMEIFWIMWQIIGKTYIHPVPHQDKLHCTDW